MEHEIVRTRAVIFDVYATLLHVGAAPADADARWNRLFEDMLGARPSLSRTEFSVRTSQVIALQHAAARARGIPWPEILWPSIVSEVLPELARLPVKKFDEFIFLQMQLGRTLRFAENAGECLRRFYERGLVLGIASNSQHYTLRELGDALDGTGLNLSIFDPHLCIWSFQQGFSKPDPHIFQIMTARLEARGIGAGETLMVGDRLDNDIRPAHAHGWQTWQLVPASQGDGKANGDFRQLLDALS
ncbi:MAG TPA: HAD family hydrolase [Methylomirabilota bacterium]|nr:HAD family hydrolase [Methylomirabilota bacterium]